MADACDKGAKIVTGGHRVDGDGAFYAPTVLTEVTPEMAIFSNEIFGPVATVVRFNTEEEAIAIANATEYGLPPISTLKT
jgi:succinate-semialdehyde dehydrogenase/glutarate-semialdehyde dehydrogenase